MTSDLAIDEMLAAALPCDWTEDFHGPVIRSTCEKCLHTFIGNASRADCKACTTEAHGDTL